jgi:hypothetical protein
LCGRSFKGCFHSRAAGLPAPRHVVLTPTAEYRLAFSSDLLDAPQALGPRLAPKPHSKGTLEGSIGKFFKPEARGGGRASFANSFGVMTLHRCPQTCSCAIYELVSLRSITQNMVSNVTKCRECEGRPKRILVQIAERLVICLSRVAPVVEAHHGAYVYIAESGERNCLSRPCALCGWDLEPPPRHYA